MAIERRPRLHRVEIMAHGPKAGGQYEIEHIDWDTEADAMVPGSGVVLPPVAITDAMGELVGWERVRDMIDTALIAGANAAAARTAELEQQRDRANSERDAAMASAAKMLEERDAALAGIVTLRARAEAAENAARRGAALAAEIANRGT